MLCRLQVALVQWTESVGLTLVGRDQSSMQLRTPGDQILNLTILQVFPFTYESKRMGIIVRVSLAFSRPQRPLSLRVCECASGALVACWGLVADTQTGKGVSFPVQGKRALSVDSAVQPAARAVPSSEAMSITVSGALSNTFLILSPKKLHFKLIQQGGTYGV